MKRGEERGGEGRGGEGRRGEERRGEERRGEARRGEETRQEQTRGGPIHMVQLCLMRYAYDKSRTRVVSCKSNLQLACDCHVRHKECRGLLKHALKPYDNHSHRQFDTMEIVYNLSKMGAEKSRTL